MNRGAGDTTGNENDQCQGEKLGLPVSELLRRGAVVYRSEQSDVELGVLAGAAKSAADRASDSIDDVLMRANDYQRLK